MAYERVNWENLPSKNTPVNADNLNKMDEGIANIDTKLNTKQEKLTAGTGIEITGTNIINNLNANYSTEEQVIGKWIDGKPLYRKTIETIVNNQNQAVSLDFSIDKLKKVEGGLDNGDQLIPFGFDADTNYCRVFIQKGNKTLYCMNSWGRGTLYITLEYTKTTD